MNINNLMTEKQEKQYLLIDEKFIEIFQEMFEFVNEFVEDWEAHQLVLSEEGQNQFTISKILSLVGNDVDTLRDILDRFQKLAHNDMIDKVCENPHTIGEA